MYDALLQMRSIIKKLDLQRIEGYVVEVGCWRGGCCAFMAYVNKKNGNERTVFALDSFEGMYSEKTEKDVGTKFNLDAATIEDAKEVVKALDVEYNTVIIKGFVQNTLPHKDIRRIAQLRLDVNIYEPTKYALETLYDLIVPGGYIICDNYEMPGERQAVDEFRAARGITSPIIKPGRWEKEYWIKH